MKRVLISIPSVVAALALTGCGADPAGTDNAATSASPSATDPGGVGTMPVGGNPTGPIAQGVAPPGTPGVTGPSAGPTVGPNSMAVGPIATDGSPVVTGTPPGPGGGNGPGPQGSGGNGPVNNPTPGGGAPPVGGGGSGPVVVAGGGGIGGAPGPEPDPMVPEPSLITSGQGAYWTVDEVTMGGANATFTVNSGQMFQEWHGWGGTFNEQGWDALQELSATERDRALTLLFDVNDGLGLDWGRIPIGPSDYANDRYTLSSGPGQFSLARDQMFLIPYVKAAQAVKGDVKYWASPWTPPPWAKAGTTENDGYDKGIFNTQYYQEYADFFIDWIQAYEAEGIPIDHVMPQNEPGWAQSYPTCAWGPARDSTNNTDISGPVTLGIFVDEYLFPAIDAAGLGTNVWFGTLSNNSVFEAYWNDMMGRPSASRIIGAGLQWETQVRVGSIAGQGYLVMQSEHKCGNYPWLGAMATSAADANRDNFLASQAPNNHAYGEESWDLIKGWIDDGVNIYSAWNMVLDTGGFNLDEVRRWPQNALLAVDRNAGTLQVTAYYHVFRHVAQYVDAGAVRIGVNGNALAFRNPDASIVTIMFNEGQSASQTTLSIDGTMVQFEIPARGWATVNWQG